LRSARGTFGDTPDIRIFAGVSAVMRSPLVILILMLGACAKQPTLPTAWTRADGRPVNSALLDIDSLDCKDETQRPDGAAHGKADKSGHSQAVVDDFVSCMREHGYVQIKS
jgi:hypothetical protein